MSADKIKIFENVKRFKNITSVEMYERLLHPFLYFKGQICLILICYYFHFMQPLSWRKINTIVTKHTENKVLNNSFCIYNCVLIRIMSL